MEKLVRKERQEPRSHLISTPVTTPTLNLSFHGIIDIIRITWIGNAYRLTYPILSMVEVGVEVRVSRGVGL